MLNKTRIKVDVVSDVVCPWCYIGKRRLEKAMAQLADQYEFDVEYHPFELNPTMPAEGANQKDYLTKKFGSAQRYEQITQHVTDVAATEGLRFDFSKQQVAPNTRAMHATIAFAKAHGKQLEAKEAYLKAYFTDGVDLSNLDNVLAIAESVGLKKDEVKAVVSNPKALEQIAAAESHMQKLGISGVPFYIINNQHGLSGAQPADVFKDVFGQLTTEIEKTGAACDVEQKDC
jgi:predicted DsbA family dithiol-disulfide isomerase